MNHQLYKRLSMNESHSFLCYLLLQRNVTALLVLSASGVKTAQRFRSFKEPNAGIVAWLSSDTVCRKKTPKNLKI